MGIFSRLIRGGATPTKANLNNGRELEEAVAEILRREGYRNVRKNVIQTDKNGNRSEIDVFASRRSWMHLLFGNSSFVGLKHPSVYVECKQYHQRNMVKQEEVAKFKEVLLLNNIPISRGLFVTTSGFVPRAMTTGITCIDGRDQRRWETQTHSSIKRIMFKRWAVFFMFWTSVALCIYLRFLRNRHLLARDMYEESTPQERSVMALSNVLRVYRKLVVGVVLNPTKPVNEFIKPSTDGMIRRTYAVVRNVFVSLFRGDFLCIGYAPNGLTAVPFANSSHQFVDEREVKLQKQYVPHIITVRGYLWAILCRNYPDPVPPPPDFD